MALWADCQKITASDLVTYDGQLASVVSAEGIDVETKSQVAHEIISAVLAKNFWPLDGEVAAARQAERVVVTPSLRRWHGILTLEGVYREAYFRHLSERHKVRADYLLANARAAMETVLESGLGTCSAPIRRARQPELSAASGNIAPGVWHFATTLCRGEQEGEGSEVTSLILTATGGIRVRTASSDLAVHVYAGSVVDRLCRQTATPMAAGEIIHLDHIERDTPCLGSGQQADQISGVDRRVVRG